MKRNMKEWIAALAGAEEKQCMPILSFPCVSLLGITVGELISDSELQAKGMQAVAERTNAASSVSFMDLSVEAECFGSTVCISESEVPTVKGRIVNDMEEAEALAVPKVGSARTGIYIDAIKKASERITDRPIFAGMIGPFSLAARLFDVSEIMIDCYDEPEMVHLVMKKVTEFLIEYAKAYKTAGADGIIVAEPVAGVLSPTLEAEFAAPYMRELISAVQDESFAFIYHNCGNNVPDMLDSIFANGAMAYHFGNAVDISKILSEATEDKIIMGNIDPVGTLLMGNPDSVREAVHSLMDKCAKYPNFVISSGCDIPPMTPWENINALFDGVESFYKK